MAVSFEKILKNCHALCALLEVENVRFIDNDFAIKLISYANMKSGYAPEEVIDRIPHSMLNEEKIKVIIEKSKNWVVENNNVSHSCSSLCYDRLSHLCESCRYHNVVGEPADLGIVDENNVIKTKQFPIDSLPPVFKDFTQQASRAIKAPIDFISTSLLVASGALIGTARALQVSPTWKIHANLYGCLIGSPSSKKSPAMSSVLKYVEDIENNLQDKYFEELEKFDKSKNEQKPRLERITTNNSTVEAIVELLSNNKRGILMASDELNSWINSMGEYKSGKNGDRQFYLSAWNSARFVVDRKGKEPLIIKKTFVSVLGSIQPTVLRNMENVGDGFFERIIFSFPEQNDAYLGSSTENIDIKTEEELSKCFDNLYKLFYAGQKIIELDTEARQCFEKFEENLAFIVKGKYFDPILEALYCKISGTCAKIALILHCVKGDSSNLSKETMASAIAITEYYLAHSKQILLMIAKEVTYRIADNVYKWILQRGYSWIQPSTISKYGVGGIKTAEDAKAVINKLIAEHRIIYDTGNKRYLILEE